MSKLIERAVALLFIVAFLGLLFACPVYRFHGCRETGGSVLYCLDYAAGR